jgi:hypothetical protein
MTRIDIKACYHFSPTSSASFDYIFKAVTTSVLKISLLIQNRKICLYPTHRILELKSRNVLLPPVSLASWYPLVHARISAPRSFDRPPGHFAYSVECDPSLFHCRRLPSLSVFGIDPGLWRGLGRSVSLCPNTVFAVCASSSSESPRRSLAKSVVASSSEPARIPPTNILRSSVRLVTDCSSRFKPSDLVKPSGACH